MRNRLLLFCLLLAFACGKKKTPAPAGGGSGETAQAQQQPSPPPAPTPSAEDREAMRKKRAELQAKVHEVEKSIKEMEERHDQELRKLPELGPLRRSYLQAIMDARSKENELQHMRERYDELKKLAESAVTGKLKSLRDERAKIQTRQDAIQDAWRQSQEDVAAGSVDESPVKKDLDTIRAVKQQWFIATPLARRGTAKESEKKIINDGFRGWLGEVPQRKRVVGETLAQPLGPKGKTPDSYDFTDLTFFILLETMEEQLEKQNIVVEKKELSEARDKLEAIQKELDAIDEKIHEQMVAGGDDLQEYEDLVERLPYVQGLASGLSTRVGELNAILKQVDEVKERQSQEENDAQKALDEAKRALAAVR